MSWNLRHNALLLFSALACVALLVLLTLTIDRQFYQRDKIDLIQERYFAAFPAQDMELLQACKEYAWLHRLGKATREQTARVRGLMRRNLAGPRPLLRLSLRCGGEPLIVESRSDNIRFNNWRNSLVPRNFEGRARMRFDESQSELVVEYASPLGFEPLLRLTTRYRLILAAVLSGVVLAYLTLLWFLILPTRRVTSAIQTSHRTGVRFIRRPRTSLESLYNVMARDALLSDLDRALESPDGRRLRIGRDELAQRLSDRLREGLGFDRATLLSAQRDGEEGPAAAIQELPQGGDKGLARFVGEEAESAFAMPHGEVRECRSGGWSVLLGCVPPTGEDEWRHVLALGRRTHASFDEWTRETVRRALGRVAGLLERQAMRSRELFRERSQANVNLARSMGHDLTNVIATAKLELMTLGQVVEGAGDDAARNAVGRLRDSTRALQRIVDLYRAYESLESPRYEPTDLNELLHETVEIFTLAMSGPARVEFDLANDLPPIRVEPRLLKLAFFNLLANARDALRDSARPGTEAPRILLQTRRADAMDEGVVVRVCDNGPGIRNEAGEEASPDEIGRVFELGYTTKQTGEGLGLNWVRTIVAEFHRGEIRAENAPEGGAVFTATLTDSHDESKSTESEQV